jgi:hypothetical protein
MAALHQDLRAAQIEGLLDFVIEFVKGDDVGVGILFDAVKSAELAIDVADVGVIDVAIDDVGGDFVAFASEVGSLGELTAAVRERAQFFEGQMIETERVGLIDARAAPNSFHQIIERRVVDHSVSVRESRGRIKFERIAG